MNDKDKKGMGDSKESPTSPKIVKEEKKEVKIDKALYKVIFQKRWLSPDGKIVDIGDIINIDKQTFDILISNKIVKEIK